MDEVQSGYGRTGKMWAFEHAGIVPDVVLVAKAIANGMPLAALVSPRELQERWGLGAHGSTYGGNPGAGYLDEVLLAGFDLDGSTYCQTTMDFYDSNYLPAVMRPRTCCRSATTTPDHRRRRAPRRDPDRLYRPSQPTGRAVQPALCDQPAPPADRPHAGERRQHRRRHGR